MSFPPLLPQDKANHSHWGAELTALVSCVLMVPVALGLLPHWTVAPIAQAVCSAVAFGKEARDARNRDRHTPEWADFFYTCRGALHVTLPLASMSGFFMVVGHG